MFSMLIPKENFWRKFNKLLNLDTLYDFLKSKFQNEALDVRRIFKCLLLKTYYEIPDEKLIDEVDANMVYKYFLEYDLTEFSDIELSEIQSFKSEQIEKDEEDVINRIIHSTISLATKLEKDTSNLIGDISKFKYRDYLNDVLKRYFSSKDKIYEDINFEDEKQIDNSINMLKEYSLNRTSNENSLTNVDYLIELLLLLKHKNANLTLQEVAIIIIHNMKEIIEL